MKRILLSFFALFACILAMSAEGTITLKTSKAAGESLSIKAYCSTSDESFSIDWGDGQEQYYTIDPNGWAYNQYARGTVKGQTITIKGDLVVLECTDAGLTSFSTSGMGKLTDLDLSNNELTNLTLTDMTALKNLNVKNNKLGTTDDSEFDITAAAPTLEILNVSDNALGSLNLMQCASLVRFYANNNADMGAVVFADGSAKLETIEMDRCGLAHFYAISLPELKTLHLKGNYLMEQEEGGSYPKLQDLDMSDNYLTELYVTSYPELERLDCSNNQIPVLNVSQNAKLTSLKCGQNTITYLNTSKNPELITLYCNDNLLTSINLSDNKKVSKLNVSGNKIEALNLESVFNLTELEAANTLCSWFNFNFVNAGGQMQYVDVRNNPRMTAQSLNAMFKTMPQHYGYRSPSLLIDGSNYEHANTDYITSNDAKWTVDKAGDGTAQDFDVNIDVKATTNGTATYKGFFGGNIIDEQSVEMTRYATQNGTFVIGQWSGDVLQTLANVNGTAKAGVPMFVMASPADGYQLKSVSVNGEVTADTCFVVNADATIEVTFGKADRVVAFTTTPGTYLAFELRAAQDGTPCSIDWGGGTPENVTVDSKATYFDNAAVGSNVKIYGDVTYVDLGSFEGFGNENEITALDVSGNPLITNLQVFMNPISTLDVSNLKDLEVLDCAYCDLEELNLSANTKLKKLNCKGNMIETLDVSGCESLYSLDAGQNFIEEIDLGHCPDLEKVDLSNNALDELDVTQLPQLMELGASGNYLSKMDVTQNPLLETLNVGANDLYELDLTANTRLQTLLFQDNKIQTIDLKHLADLATINCGGNGMTACDLDAFYASLPQRRADIGSSTLQDVSLRLNNGTESRPNDAENSDTSIATNRGWTVNVAGNASGCPQAIVEIVPNEGGTIVLTDDQGNTIQSGDLVKKGTVLTVTAKPNFGYTFDGDIMVNGTVKFNVTTLTVTRYLQLEPMFSLDPTGIDDINNGQATIKGGQGTISVTAATGTQAYVYTMNGQAVAHATLSDGHATISVKAGVYMVKTNGKQGATKVIVK